MGDIFSEMKDFNLSIIPVENNEFQECLQNAKNDSLKAKHLTSFIAYEKMGNGENVVQLIKENSYTIQVLHRLGYSWPLTSFDYNKRFLNSLFSLNFFNI